MHMVDIEGRQTDSPDQCVTLCNAMMSLSSVLSHMIECLPLLKATCFSS